jgi:hypothetical protein
MEDKLTESVVLRQFFNEMERRLIKAMNNRIYINADNIIADLYTEMKKTKAQL